MTTDKEELRNVINDSLFGFKDEEYGFTQAETAILIKVEKLLEAKDKECAAKIAAGERLRMEDAMSAINEANGLREKIKEQELIIYGIEEGAEQWKSLCADKDKENEELKRICNENEKTIREYGTKIVDCEKKITDLKAEIERLKGGSDELRHALQIIQNFIEDDFKDWPSLKEAWNLISNHITMIESTNDK